MIYPDCADKRESGRYIARVTGRDTLTDFANAAMIVSAVNERPALLDWLAKLEAEVERLRVQLEPFLDEEEDRRQADEGMRTSAEISGLL